MKNVAGTIINTKPISLSKAASVLSTFSSAETGASQAVSTYLRRASMSFDELVRFHREISANLPQIGLNRKQRGRQSKKRESAEEEDEDEGERSEISECLSPVEERESGDRERIEVESHRRRKKKKRRRQGQN